MNAPWGKTAYVTLGMLAQVRASVGVALLSACLSAFGLSAQVVTLRAGATVAKHVVPGTRLAVPIVVDLSAGAGTSVRSLQMRVSWATARLTFDSVRSSSFGVLTSSAADVASGSLSLSSAASSGTTTTAEVATLYFTANTTAGTGGTRILLTPIAVDNDLGASVVTRLRLQHLEVCVAPGVLWGDSNSDNVVNIIDAQQIARHSVGLSVANETALAAQGDVTEDGTVNVVDAQQIARYTVALSAVPRVGVAFPIVPAVNALFVNPLDASVYVGSATQLLAEPRDASNNALNGCQPVSFSSGAPTIASVDSAGRVFGLTSGIATITAASGSKTTTSSIYVGPPDAAKYQAIASVNFAYLAVTNYEPSAFMHVAADALTSNFSNFGMRFSNLEPRIAYANNSAGSDRGVTEAPWDSYYQALRGANDAIQAFDAGVVPSGGVAEAGKYRRLAQMSQAWMLSQLALTFDQALIMDENTVTGAAQTPLSAYRDVAASAVAKWTALADAEAGKTDTYEPSVFPLVVGPLTSARIQRFANTMAALTLAYAPRNAAEASAVNWAQVRDLAARGIGSGLAGTPFDMDVIGDFNNWYSSIVEIGAAPSWLRVDLRLINRMDPGTPLRMTSTTPPPRGSSVDARFDTDYAYLTPIPGDPGRGVYMLSPYYHTRYYAHGLESPTFKQTPVPFLLAAESDLVRAEAIIRTNGDFATAATLINLTRVGRGHLAPASASDGATTLLAYIDYERDVELLNTNGYTLFQRRHVDGLQPFTPVQLPVPARVLESRGLPVYTFGGPGG
ncbi:MAG: dockerin type I domain-containing protein [Gemmatimonadota bacterium]